MDKLSFLFLISLYILLSIFASAKSVDFSVQLIGCMTLIALVGIPHGAIDHILFQESNPVKPYYFYLFYFGMMAVYLAGWLIFAQLSLILFLLISSYHFGQSQFNDVKISSTPLKLILQFSWGCSILSGLVWYNHVELIELFATQEDLNPLIAVFDPIYYNLLLPLSSILVLFILLKLLMDKAINIDRALREVYMLLIVHFCFYTLPVLVGFTLYFVVLHSFRVLSEEYQFLQTKKRNLTLLQFVLMLLPLTLISLLGGLALIYLCISGWMNLSSALLILILISILTLPHSIVMELFYRKYSIILKSQ